MNVSFPDLDQEQLAAVTSPIAPTLVAAGPGSGKTRVIANRVSHLVDNHDVQPRHIAVFTFTNKAARELRERLGATLPPHQAREVQASTFHSWGLRLLTQHSDLGDRFTIYARSDALTILRSIYQDSNGRYNSEDFPETKALDMISNWKNELVTPTQAFHPYVNSPDFGHISKAAQIYIEYQSRLVANSAVDLDDLIYLPATLLEQDPNLLSDIRNRHQHILIDEYQDTNIAQQRLSSILAGESPDASIFVVGDPDQSIYAFRNANVKGILRFAQTYPTCTQHTLNNNYRSRPTIVRAAQTLISVNKERIDRASKPVLTQHTPLVWKQHSDQYAEARSIADTIKASVRSGHANYSQFSICYRTNLQAHPLEAALQDADIPYHVTGKYELFNRAEVKVCHNYLKMAWNPQDDAAVLNTINVPPRGIGQTTQQALRAYANEHDMLINDLLQQIADDDPHCTYQEDNRLATRAYNGIRQYVTSVRDLYDLATTATPQELIIQIRTDLGIDEWLELKPDGAERKDNLERFIEHFPPDRFDGGSLGSMLEIIATTQDKGEDHDTAPDRVSVSTLHQTKGLEFDYVILAGIEDNLVPYRSAQDDYRQIEEERRLLYVGITRARAQLLVNWCARRRTDKATYVDCTPSRFLYEIPTDLWRAPLPEITYETASADNPSPNNAPDPARNPLESPRNATPHTPITA